MISLWTHDETNIQNESAAEDLNSLPFREVMNALYNFIDLMMQLQKERD